VGIAPETAGAWYPEGLLIKLPFRQFIVSIKKAPPVKTVLYDNFIVMY
jgi:hypothetical protein